MTYLWTILGIVAGGGLGYLYGSWRKRREEKACETPTWRATSGPWSGAISGAILGLVLVILIISSP